MSSLRPSSGTLSITMRTGVLYGARGALLRCFTSTAIAAAPAAGRGGGPSRVDRGLVSPDADASAFAKSAMVEYR
jgi:hypothetical protein